MLNAKQDIAALLFYYMHFSWVRNIILKNRCIPVARIFVFHDVLEDERSRMEKNLHFLKHNTNVISLDDFFSNKLRVDKINTIITFDDGYKGWIDNALPALKMLNLPATFFISSGFVGLQKNDEMSYIKKNIFVTLPPRKITGGLTIEDVRTLVSEGFAIGGHTFNHCSLDLMNDPEKLRYEINEDKFRLEKMTGKRIDYFSYPTGAYKNTEINLINELMVAGYKGAVTVDAGFNNLVSNRYLLHRDIIDAWMSLPIFKARVFGDIDAVRLIKRWGGLAL